MNRYVMEEFYSDPALRRRLFDTARRERTLAVREGLAWLGDGIARVSAKIVARLKPRHPATWLARLG